MLDLSMDKKKLHTEPVVKYLGSGTQGFEDDIRDGILTRQYHSN